MMKWDSGSNVLQCYQTKESTITNTRSYLEDGKRAEQSNGPTHLSVVESKFVTPFCYHNWSAIQETLIPKMKVVTSDGDEKDVSSFGILLRLQKLNKGLKCDLNLICDKVLYGVYGVVPISQLDGLIGETVAAMNVIHPDYAILATRFEVSILHNKTKKSFSENSEISGQKASLIADDVYETIIKYATKLDNEIKYERDNEYDYISFKTLERFYLLKINGKVVESPQDMLMRVSVGIHMDDIDSVIKSYHLMSEGWFTHASPTLFKAGTPNPQLSSYYQLCIKEDSIEGHYDTLKKCAVISKSAGGIGVSVNKIGSTGTFNDTIPMLHVINDTACYIDQGGGRRNGVYAVYLEPWHDDIFEFLDLMKNHRKTEHARDLSYALWVPDLFMKRVKSAGNWTLFCPNEAPELADCWGQKFEELYTQYEREGKSKKVVDAEKLWSEVLKSQIETGAPYILFKDSCNSKSNQQNLGTIKSSNLYADIIEYASPTETAVCNMASIALPRFVREKGVSEESQPSKLVGSIGSGNRYFDFDKLAEITSVVTTNLNKTIDVNHYPIETAKMSNLRNRPIGIGVQGLADTFILLGMPFDSPQAHDLNKDIFETIYYHAMETSSKLSEKEGTYATYDESPVSKGTLQPDMWKVTPSERWNWESLRTVSRATFFVVNKHLLNDLTQMGIWSPDLMNQIICEDGSVQKISVISEELRDIYKTVWEIEQKTLVDMAADRGCYIDQSQSLNIFIDQPDFQKLEDLHFHAWDKGLKTGMYCLRSRDAVGAINFTLDTSFFRPPNDVEYQSGKMLDVTDMKHDIPRQHLKLKIK
ncbi:unnamed protein product [Lactuca virosa]|uniref:Ribonucleoside-diphosphate reductase n=1 Tax=Lactuca virosa TaxID=75947 RepID=A0AAU9NAE9_9ASTR|nr:unnamed protein product [Lactuca virosa]